ncbi:MAG: transcriptional regulator [Candidatus Doudnabacteria bacterium CG10_big_fil_rev_8_21_14_0_10_42_18]|uniref:Transcriptional regulator n=1 Tax=Candidatus Doudnabacteria bacterium CG10_big_fil_rev_8_21_14_0_10_42_18 TaxID=1974552 RepID=A0A2H0VAI5_9BACT|nr:MAG: transcriptional regulator [Candidatus Doudnabacteria bacterium CG10_big_fil_rev_8_21_14_0_10_42_18]
MDIEVILKNFGLSEKEIAVYLALIELGPSSVREISAKSKVNRGTTYDILKSLISLGVVSYYNKESKQYFAAEEPEKLLSALDQKQEDLQEVRSSIKENLPFIKTLFEKQGGRPMVKYYEGLSGIKNILQDVLETMAGVKDKTYYIYSSSDIRKNVYLAMKDFSEKRIRKGIKVQSIALGKGGQLVGLDQRKWMELPEKDLKATYEIIYGGKVAHISLDNSENPVGVVIQNDEIYQTQKLIFKNIWSRL